jgi:Ser/Thr protein kinase RdoA (MazF antagonist)
MKLGRETYHPVCEEALSLYPFTCHPRSIRPLETPYESDGSGIRAELWRVETVTGPMLLKRWPAEQPTAEHLEFVHAVLWHAANEGFDRLATPVIASDGRGFVFVKDHLWQLEPWMYGQPDFADAPSEDKLAGALMALAEFHNSVAGFPIAQSPLAISSEAQERLAQLRRIIASDFEKIVEETLSRSMPAPIKEASHRILRAAPPLFGNLMTLLTRSARLVGPVQPCLRSVRAQHIFYEEDYVTGLVDFVSLGVDSPALDVARLLGEMAGDDPQLWNLGLNAYQLYRDLSDAERYLIVAFDRVRVLSLSLRRLQHPHLEAKTLEVTADRLEAIADSL